MLVRRGKQSVKKLMDHVRELQDRLAQLEQTYAVAQSEGKRLTKALVEAQMQVVALQTQVTRLQEQWTVTKDRLIAVLKLSGRCTVRTPAQRWNR